MGETQSSGGFIWAAAAVMLAGWLELEVAVTVPFLSGLNFVDECK